MSEESNSQASRVWFKQAVEDLDVARLLCANGHYALAMFHAQQSAEKSIKSVSLAMDIDLGRDHYLRLLLKKFPENISKNFIAKIPSLFKLDQYYMQTRYPDMFGNQAAPVEMFGKRDAEEAIVLASKTMDTTRKLLPNLIEKNDLGER